MNIVDHRLVGEDGANIVWASSDNYSDRNIDHKYLVIHYTAGASFDSSVRWLRNPASGASAHIVIGRDGDIAQLVAFDKQAWHAGQSRWRGLTGLNKFSIGIELDNAGPMIEKVPGQLYKSSFGGSYPVTDVVRADHQHGSEYHFWHEYTDVQLQTAIEVARALVTEYELIDVIGHDDIAPGRKRDPGPAFPMDWFRSAVMGREEEDLPIGIVSVPLNIRSGPGADYPTIAAPLQAGTPLLIKMRMSSWLAVDVVKDGRPELSGWVHGDYVLDI